jgi:6-phosphofructokinase 1
MVDAKTTSRWYFVVTMGRKAGHLALGIGKSAGASLTLIPEEFQGHVTLKRVVDTLAGAIIKRLADGRPDGVAILAEGLVEGLSPEDLTNLAGHAERDAHDNLRIAEVDFGEILKAKVLESLKKYGLKPTIVAKNIGYELRCADPVPFDMEYTRDLGYCAAKYLDEGGSGVMVTMQQDAFQPLPFTSMMDPKTGRTKVRMVDIQAERYKIARRYMIRLRRDDFEDPHALAKYAATARIGLEQFRADYEYLVEDEPLPVQLLRPAAIVKSDAGKELPLVETAAKATSKKGA